MTSRTQGILPLEVGDVNEETTLRRNVGPADRVLRLVIAVVLVWVGAVANWNPWLKAVVAALGGVQLLTGLSGY